MTTFKNKIAIVTGVSRLNGIGAGICRKLSQNGYHIFFTNWMAYDKAMPWETDENEPMTLMNELKESGVKVAALELDLSLPESAQILIDKVTETLGQPDILINNAAYSTNDDYKTLTAESLDKHYQINIRATTLLSLAFAKSFKKGHGGRIINLTSGQFQGPMPGEIAYATTKGAIDALTITLSAELAPLGITVNAVNPGPTDTGWMTEEIKENLKPLFPFGRIGKASDLAKVINFLASDEGDWITGQTIHSEGGFRR